MYAHIVLAGGGVKGAVLAGCLKAVEDKGVVPLGLGGTSAGSIVALLASVGYSGAELEHILINNGLTEFLDDGGVQLDLLKRRRSFDFARRTQRQLRNTEFNLRHTGRILSGFMLFCPGQTVPLRR